MAAPKKNKTKSQPPATVQNFPIIGIGASAGGLDAFKKFLEAIPIDSGMAYVLVQHLDPTHDSILPEILSRATKIPIHEITSDKIIVHTVWDCKQNPDDLNIINIS